MTDGVVSRVGLSRRGWVVLVALALLPVAVSWLNVALAGDPVAAARSALTSEGGDEATLVGLSLDQRYAFLWGRGEARFATAPSPGEAIVVELRRAAFGPWRAVGARRSPA